MIVRAERVLLPDGVLEDGVVERDGDLVLDVRKARAAKASGLFDSRYSQV